MNIHIHVYTCLNHTACPLPLPWVPVGELVDAPARKLLRVVQLDLLVRHAVAHPREELVQVVPRLRVGVFGVWGVGGGCLYFLRGAWGRYVHVSYMYMWVYVFFLFLSTHY